MRQKCNRRVRTQLQQATRPVGRCWAERSCGWICRLVVFFPSLAPSSPAANATERLYHSSGRPETESGKKNNRASPGTHFTPQEKITPQRRTFQFFLCLVSKSARLYQCTLIYCRGKSRLAEELTCTCRPHRKTANGMLQVCSLLNPRYKQILLVVFKVGFARIKEFIRLAEHFGLASLFKASLNLFQCYFVFR